jgi:hypothetical protein
VTGSPPRADVSLTDRHLDRVIKPVNEHGSWTAIDQVRRAWTAPVARYAVTESAPLIRTPARNGSAREHRARAVVADAHLDGRFGKCNPGRSRATRLFRVTALPTVVAAPAGHLTIGVDGAGRVSADRHTDEPGLDRTRRCSIGPRSASCRSRRGTGPNRCTEEQCRKRSVES